MTTLTDHQAYILNRHGFELSPNGMLAFANAERARNTTLHHTFTPIAAVGWARLAPAVAAHRLPDYQLSQLVTKRPAMDCFSAECFALACGIKVMGPFANRPQPFYQHLCALIDRYNLQDFFGHYPTEGEYHYSVRPRAVDWANGSTDLPEEMRRFRTSYRKLPPAKQMLIASILWLYCGSAADQHWMTRLPRSWNALLAILELDAAGMLSDWAELVTRYPGW